MAPHFEAAARLLDECDSPCLEKRMHTFRMEVQKENLLIKFPCTHIRPSIPTYRISPADESPTARAA